MLTSVIYLDDDIAEPVLRMIDQKSSNMVARHLAQWDNGTDTDDRSRYNGHSSDKLHVYMYDRYCDTDVGGLTYTLRWNTRLRYVELLREELA